MRLLILSTLTVALLLAGASSAGAQPGKDKDKTTDWPTEVGGKTAKEWIEAIPQSNRSESVKALQVVLMFGPKESLKAVPVILKELAKHKPAAGKPIDASFVSKAPAALAMIMTAQKEPDKKQTEEIIDALRVLLKDPQIPIRFRTLVAITQFGPYIERAKDEIILMVRDPATWEIRHAACTALGGFPFDRDKGKGAPPTEVSEALLKYGLKDTSSSVKLAALHAIDQLNLPELENTAGAVDGYIKELLKVEQKDYLVRITAHLVAYGINKDMNATRRKAFASYLNPKVFKESAVRLEAVQALNRIAADAEDQVGPLLACLDDKEGSVRLAAFQTLGHIGAAAAEKKGAPKTMPLLSMLAKKFASYLEGAGKDKEPAIRGAALQAIGALGLGAQNHLKLITDYVSNEKEEWPVRLAGIQSLGTLGKVAYPWKDELYPYLQPKHDPPVRIAAIQALGNIAPGDKEAMPKLLECLQDKQAGKENDANILGAAAFTFARMGKLGFPAVPRLAAIAADRDHPAQLRQVARDAVDEITGKNKKDKDKDKEKK